MLFPGPRELLQILLAEKDHFAGGDEIASRDAVEIAPEATPVASDGDR